MIPSTLTCQSCARALKFEGERAQDMKDARQIKFADATLGHAFLVVEVPVKDTPQFSRIRPLCEEVYPSQIRLEIGVAADYYVSSLELAELLKASGESDEATQVRAGAAFSALLAMESKRKR